MKQSKGDGVRGQDCRQKGPWDAGRRAPSAARWSPRRLGGPHDLRSGQRRRAAQGVRAQSQRPPTLRQAFPPTLTPRPRRSPAPRSPSCRHSRPLQPRPTRSGNGSEGRGRPLTRLAWPSAAPRFPETSPAARVVAGTLGAWLGLPCPEAPSAFSKWLAHLLPLRK